MLRVFKLVIVSLVFVFSLGTATAQHHKYIKKYKPIAEELSQQYEIPSSVILAVAFVETGGGTSKNSKMLNNHFGIIGKNNTGGKSVYKQYSSVRASYEGFCKLLTRKKYYNRLKGTDDFSTWVKAIASAGYSTQPDEWKRRLHLIYDTFNLHNL